MALTGENLIGATRSAEGLRRLRGIDPRTSTTLEPAFAEATSAEVNRAMELADAAFREFRLVPDSRRADLLEAIAGAIRSQGESIVARAASETGLPEARLRGEVGRTTGQLELFAKLVRDGSWVDARIDLGDPSRTPAAKPDVRRMLIALGPVVVFGTSNFPLAFSVAGGDTASALAAGCSVVVKGHPAHPGTSELVAACVLAATKQTNLPDGIFSLLHGSGHEVGVELVNHPLTRAVGFTGSLRGGRALFDAATKRAVPIPVFAEMGSTNPVFILPRALEMQREKLATALHASVTLGVGQFCTNPGVAILPPTEEANEFKRSLSELVRETPAGPMLYEGIGLAFEEGVKRMAAVSGVALLARADGSEQAGTTFGRSAVLTVSAGDYLDHPELGDEVFGPSTLVVDTQSRQDILRLARSLEGHLTATVWAADGEIDEYQDLVDILTDKVGRLIFNGMPTGVEVGPAMHHGGPYPATTDARFTSVGTAAILRFARPIAFQDAPETMLPPHLQDKNPHGIMRLVDGVPSREPVTRQEDAA